jgi:class 3 adenylate cyclase
MDMVRYLKKYLFLGTFNASNTYRLVILLIYFLSHSALLIAETPFPEPIHVNQDPDIALNVFNNLEFLPASEGELSSAQIGSGAYDARFVKLQRSQRAFTSNHYEWFKLSLKNLQTVPIEVVLFNQNLVHSLIIVQRSERVPTKELRVGIQEYRNGDFIYPAAHLRIPPGDSTLYLGIHTNKKPFTLNFELRSHTKFSSYYINRILLTSGILLGMVSIFFYNLFLFLVMRSRLYIYYLIALLGLIGFEGAITGGLILLTPFILPIIDDLWRYSFFVCISGCGLFIFEYFEISRLKNPRIFYSMLVVISASLVNNLVYDMTWRIASHLVSLILLAFFIVIFMAVKTVYRAAPERVWLFLIAFLPILAAGAAFSVAFIFYEDANAFNQILLISAFFNAYALSFLVSQKIDSMNRVREALEASLKSIIPPIQLEKVLRNRISIDSKPVVRYVSIMFVDIVGYSIAIRKLLPEESFYALKHILNEITNIVLMHGGIIDKSLGDGCLCFFGYDMAGGSTTGHEVAVIRCALEIQRRSVEIINRSSKTNSSEVFPLRIGINSAEVCIGNMGDNNRFDFTMVGDGVIMAARFEAACEPFKIIVGPKTYESAKIALNSLGKFYSRLIPIKHDLPLVESFEIDPFQNDKKALEKARRKYWEWIKVSRRHERFVAPRNLLIFGSQFGEMLLLDFSFDGMCLSSPVFLGRGVEISLELIPTIDDPLAYLINPMTLKTIWGAPGRVGDYMIGTKIIGLSDENRSRWLEVLKKKIVFLDVNNTQAKRSVG